MNRIDHNENMRGMIKEILCVFIAGVIVFLLFQNSLETTIYPICILFAFLMVMIVSGNIEINIGNLVKIKKDMERISKDISEMKFIFKAQQNQKSSQTLNFSLTGGGDVATKYYDSEEEPLDVEDADENAFYNTTSTSGSQTLKL